MKFAVFLFVTWACLVESFSLNVTTGNGLIVGHWARNRSQVAEFLGIPFAAPPIGHLRFSPPQKYQLDDDSNVVIASHYSRDCPQTPGKRVKFPLSTPQEQRIVANFANQNGNPQSEDCLYLNVWTKASNATNKPVLVFFYGGKWTFGTTNIPIYNGQYLADAEDIVVVTVNLRMSIFGYPGTPGESQNLGLQDQRMSVEWVRDNIAAFSGDPSRITIAGQATGSVSVQYWPYIYREDPIIAGAIGHSGTVYSFPTNSMELAAWNWYNVSSQLGCGDSGDVLACMRDKSFEAVRDAAALVQPPPSTSEARSQPVFQPTIDNVTIFPNYFYRSLTGQYAKLPLLVGHTDNEAGYYKISAYAKGTILNDSQWETFNRETFTCPTSLITSQRAAVDAPTWRFRYFGDWDNLRLHPTSGAYHGADLEMIFGASTDVTGLPESTAEAAVKHMMQSAWAAFMKDPECGLEELGWPQYDERTIVPPDQTLVLLGYNNTVTPQFVSPDTYDSTCTTFLSEWIGTRVHGG